MDHREVGARSGPLIPAVVGDFEIELWPAAPRPLAGLANPTVVGFFVGNRLGSGGGREVAAVPSAGGRKVAALAIPPRGREVAAVPQTRWRDVPPAPARGGPTIDRTAGVRIVGGCIGRRSTRRRPILGPTVNADVVMRERVTRERVRRSRVRPRAAAGGRVVRRPIQRRAIVSGSLVAIRVIRLDHAAAYVTPPPTNLTAGSLGAVFRRVTRPWQFRARDYARIDLVAFVAFRPPTALCPGLARFSVIGGRWDALFPYGRPSVDDAQLGAGLVDVPLLAPFGHAKLPAAVIGAHFRPAIAVAHLRPTRIVGQIPTRIRLLIKATRPVSDRLPHLRQIRPQPLLGP